MSAGLRVCLIAGEPSGDQLGAHLMAGLKAEMGGDVVFSGIGGPMMQAEGLESRFDMGELSVMGIVEVLPRLPGLLRRIRETADFIIADPPDVLITIDSPDFCLRVARKVRAARPGQKIVHYVAPSVWAWRPERATKMAAHVDHVLALLPFEPPYMEAAGMSCDFVGHPVAAFPQVGAAAAQAFRAGHGIAEDAPLLCLLPGSRRSEISNHSGVFRDVLARLAHDVPGLRSVLPVAPSVSAEVRAAFGDAPTAPILLEAGLEPKLTAYAASDAALAVSGTVSIELASQSTPMVIAYTTSAMSRWIIRRKFLLDTATLVNIVSETRAVPEFIFERFKADGIAADLRALLQDPEAARDQIAAAEVTMARLGRGDVAAGTRAARSVLSFLG